MGDPPEENGPKWYEGNEPTDKRYRSTDDRSRPMLAYECRRPGGVLWAFAGLPRCGR